MFDSGPILWMCIVIKCCDKFWFGQYHQSHFVENLTIDVEAMPNYEQYQYESWNVIFDFERNLKKTYCNMGWMPECKHVV